MQGMPGMMGMSAPRPYGGSVFCPMGHNMQFTTSTDGCPFSYFTCDRCHENVQPCANGRWYCFSCKTSYCPRCNPSGMGGMPPPPPMPYSAPMPMPSPYPSPYPVPGSYPQQYPAPNPYAPAPSQATCKQGHPLYMSTSAAGYYDGTYTCGVCMQRYSCSTPRYSCSMCNYDVCTRCKPY